jgi:hypothetical protein
MQRHEAQAPTAPFSDWPPRRVFEVRNDTVLHVTPKDVVIGRSYVRPPARLGSEAERIQAAFLPPAPRSIDGKVALIAAWLGVFALLCISKGWF